MLSKLSNDLSGIVINQNQKPGPDDWTLPVGQVFQEFYLPTTFARGATSERIVPELSGFALLLGVNSTTISLDWTLEYQVFGIGWVTVASGTETKTPHVGNRAWTTVNFSDPIDIPEEALENRWHIGIKVNSGIDKVWYSTPNPLELPNHAKATQADGWTSLGTPNFSFLFRVLALTADSGIDFLGNAYRSVVSFNKPDNTSTVDGDKDKFWLSKPNPSRFAVENLYYDVRPSREVPTYDPINRIRNPNGKNTTSAVSGWNTWANGPGTYSLTAANDPEFEGGGMLAKITGSTNGNSYIPFHGYSNDPNAMSWARARPGEILAFRCKVKVKTQWPGNAGGMNFVARSWTGSTLSYQTFETTAPMGSYAPGTLLELTGVYQVPSGMQGTTIETSLNPGTGGGELVVGELSITKLDTLTSPLPPYFDGDRDSYVWMGTRHASPSAKVVPPAPLASSAVVDRVLIDPLTPGVYFSIYYTNEGDPGTTPDEWDQKLWTRVPQTFHAVKRETHVLPEPIQARYIKVEFSHLQARPYAPGNFAKPVTYQKHPKWVLDYFLARTASARETTSALDVGQVSVRFDAYDLAYNYYLDDLGQSPVPPFEIDKRFQSQVSKYLSTRDDLSDKLDPAMIDRIRIALAPYREPISAFTNSNTILGGITTADMEGVLEHPVERGTLTYTDTQQLRNTAVVFENDYPVMFFFLTCRHAYRVVKASFDSDRAYFVGLKEIAFTRENYTVAYDTDLYIEPHGDLVNTERNDFAQVEGSLVV